MDQQLKTIVEGLQVSSDAAEEAEEVSPEPREAEAEGEVT